MSAVVLPITPSFVAEVGDVDLSCPLRDEDWRRIQESFARYSVLVFPAQQLTVDAHLDFARQFGPLERSVAEHRPWERQRVAPEIADVSNLDQNNQIWGADSHRRRHELGNRLWHTDSSFRATPAKVSLLYARSIPPLGGHTEFADLRAAWDALPPARQSELATLRAEHCIRYSRARIGFTEFSVEEREGLPPVAQPLVREHPETGRRSLYLASHAGGVLGLPPDEGRQLIDELIAHATQRQFVYTHRWRVGDLVIWDNRCTMHRGTEFDDIRFRRDVQRATVADDGPL